MDREKFIYLIETIKFKEAIQEFEKIGEIEQRNLLMEASESTESIAILGFLDYLYNLNWSKEKILDWYILILTISLCHVEGAYGLGLYYAKKIYQDIPNVQNLEYILSFYGVPEKLIDDDEALQIASKILKLDPKNKNALNIIDNIKNSKKAN